MPPCPFLWHVVPLPARYNVGCVNATSLPDLALRSTSWLVRESYWALQWDGEPFATRLATERCDALCRVGAHLVEKISKS